MILGMAVNVGAATDTHTYKVYQIFSGTTSTNEEGATIISNIAWGSGINSADFLSDLQSSADFDDAFDGCTSAKQVAQAMSSWKDNSAKAKAFAKLADKNKKGSGSDIGTELAAGYYLVVDTTDVAGKADSKNLSLLKLAVGGVFTPELKRDVPSVDKKVNNDGTMADYGTAAVGDTLDYCITGTLPSDIGEYETYEMKFSDELSAGLDYVLNSDKVAVVVKAGNTTLTADKYTVTTDGRKMSVTITDLKKAATVTADTKVTVSYQAKVNANAVQGSAGNANTAYIEYSNNPNYGGTGLGKTPSDIVDVYIFGITVNKTDEDSEPLTGAAFDLYRKTGSKDTDWTKVTEDSREAVSSTFKWSKLDAGQYKLVETTTPDGYDTMEDKIFTIEPTIEKNASTGLYELKAVKVGETSGNASTGVVTLTVVNNKGGLLPATGGVGTVLFYALGAMLICGGLVLLMLRKKSN